MVFNRLGRYNPGTDTWTRLTDAPGTTWSGNIIWISDGYLYALQANLNLFYRYNINTDTWSTRTLTGGPDSSSPGEVWAVYFNGIGYVLDLNNGLWAYDEVSDTWETLTASPIDHGESPGFWYVNGQVVIVGGDILSVSGYTPSSDSWNSLSALPEGRTNLVNSVAGHNLELRVFGGLISGVETDEVLIFS